MNNQAIDDAIFYLEAARHFTGQDRQSEVNKALDALSGDVPEMFSGINAALDALTVRGTR